MQRAGLDSRNGKYEGRQPVVDLKGKPGGRPTLSGGTGWDREHGWMGKVRLGRRHLRQMGKGGSCSAVEEWLGVAVR